MNISDFRQRYEDCNKGFSSKGDNRRPWLRYAGLVHQDLDLLVPVGVFSKPPSLPSVLKIRQAQDKLRSGGTSKKARALMGEYNVWLGSVLSAECENAGRLVTVLKAYCILSEAEKRNRLEAETHGDTELGGLAARAAVQCGAARLEVRHHIVTQWANGKQWHEPVHGHAEIDALAQWYCRRTDLLPTWLMNGNDIPDSAYDAEGVFAGDMENEFEDDDESPRRRAEGTSGGDVGKADFTIPDFSPGSSHD